MPIPYRIDPESRLVIAEPVGTMTPEDLFAYQAEVWSRPDLAGFDELVDMSGVERIVGESPAGMRELARLSAGMDSPASPSKMAIVAARDLHFGLGRMYQTLRSGESASTKQVRTFRTTEEARAWLAENRACPNRKNGA